MFPVMKVLVQMCLTAKTRIANVELLDVVPAIAMAPAHAELIMITNNTTAVLANTALILMPVVKMCPAAKTRVATAAQLIVILVTAMVPALAASTLAVKKAAAGLVTTAPIPTPAVI